MGQMSGIRAMSTNVGDDDDDYSYESGEENFEFNNSPTDDVIIPED